MSLLTRVRVFYVFKDFYIFIKIVNYVELTKRQQNCIFLMLYPFCGHVFKHNENKDVTIMVYFYVRRMSE